MFNPVLTRVEDILNTPAQFAIPLYQRDFQWGRDEARELLEDLQSYADVEKDTLFLGTMIFERTGVRQTYVVDGQQRLTTLLLLLTACRRRALDLDVPALAQMILSKITFIDPTTAQSVGSRLIASESIREVFDFITRDSWDGNFPTHLGKRAVRRQANRLRPTYQAFSEIVATLDQPALSRFLGAIYNAAVIRIDIESEVEALKIFERTNARGMELEISDLLKNFLFSEKVERIDDRWTQIRENSGGTLLRTLKYFYVSRRGHILKARLYKQLKEYAREITAAQFTQELVRFTEFYSTVARADDVAVQSFFESRDCPQIAAFQPRFTRITASLQALREFGVTQFCPPAYGAVEAMMRLGKGNDAGCAKATIRLFAAFENYHFINNAICRRVGNEVEKLYADFCRDEFATTGDLIRSIDVFVNELRKRLAKEDEFVANFVDLTYAPSRLSLLAYIFDRFNNYNLDTSQWVRIYNPEPKLLRRNQNIEHFLPQNPTDQTVVDANTADIVDNIGNLLSVSYITNSRLGNLPPAQKVERLRGPLGREIQNLNYIARFLDEYGEEATTWDRDRIMRRAEKMAHEAYRQIWKLP